MSFECQRCGNCCRWGGLVRITPEETDAIAEFLHMAPETFIAQYTILCPDRTGLSLSEKENGVCIFFDEENISCIINPVKPVQCRNFPVHWNFPGWEKECAGSHTLA